MKYGRVIEISDIRRQDCVRTLQGHEVFQHVSLHLRCNDDSWHSGNTSLALPWHLVIRFVLRPSPLPLSLLDVAPHKENEGVLEVVRGSSHMSRLSMVAHFGHFSFPSSTILRGKEAV